VIKIIKWVPAILCASVINYFSSLSGPTVNAMGLGDEAFHFGGHFILFMFLCASLFIATGDFLVSIMGTVTYGFIDEFHQLFTPMRSSSLYDVFVDFLGALISGVALWILLPKIPKKLRQLLKI
jgi:VanZ family protein